MASSHGQAVEELTLTAMANDHWKNKSALITGASDGLGWELAQQLAIRGAHVLLVARGVDRLEQRRQWLVERGFRATAIPTDVTNREQVELLWQTIQATHDRLDCLINNVGVSTRRSLAQTDPNDFFRQMEINFFATVNVTQIAMPLLLASTAHVVNIASLAAKSPWPYLGPYGASKAALAAYTHQLRVELGQRLKVLLVCSGPIARDDAGTRYIESDHQLPSQAHQPGGGARVRGIAPDKLAVKILRAMERNQAELVLPWHARLVFAVAQLSPRWGDWLLRNFGGAKNIPTTPR